MRGKKAGVYQFGYGRPPPDKRFKKGQSGNPKGRPKGSKNLTTLLAQRLGAKVVIRVNGKEKRVTMREAIAMRLCESALKGDHRATLTIVQLDRAEFTCANRPRPQ